MPDLQQQFADVYAGDGLYTVAVDPYIGDYDAPGAVADYADSLDVRFPVILEESEITPTYVTLSGDNTGATLFPLDVVVDRQGIIRYVSREYEADALHAIIQDLLSE